MDGPTQKIRPPETPAERFWRHVITWIVWILILSGALFFSGCKSKKTLIQEQSHTESTLEVNQRRITLESSGERQVTVIPFSAIDSLDPWEPFFIEDPTRPESTTRAYKRPDGSLVVETQTPSRRVSVEESVSRSDQKKEFSTQVEEQQKSDPAPLFRHLGRTITLLIFGAIIIGILAKRWIG